MKIIARLLILVSFLSGSYLASLDALSMNWTWFVPAILIGVTGLVIMKREEHAETRSSDLLEQNQEVLATSLERIIANLRDLDGRKESIPPYDMRFEIDKLFREDLDNFADARKSMQHLFSLQVYADIMNSFAAGERYINRVWSASTDGYVDEVMLYVSKARAQFEEAGNKFEMASAAAVTAS